MSPKFGRALQALLLDVLTPLGVLIYGSRLWWAECKLRACQRSKPTGPELNDLVMAVSRLRGILEGNRI